jgi:hypothetical protein
MNLLLLVVWPGFCAVAGGLLVYFVMQSRTEVILAQQREELGSARAALAVQKESMEDSLRNAGESARNQAMDEFLADIRVEERHYTRQHKVLFLTKKSLIRQERIFFRNIPLTGWVEQEMQLEEGVDAELLARTTSIFGGEFLSGSGEQPVRKLIR